MYINSNIWSAKLYEVNNGSMNAADSSPSSFNLNKIDGSARNIVNLHNQGSKTGGSLQLPGVTEISVKDADRKQSDTSKFLGHFYNNGEVRWDMIENDLMGAIRPDIIKGDAGTVTSAADVEFMDRLVIKEASFREKLQKAFSGEEQKEYLDKFEEIVSRVKDRQVDIFAQGIGDFFNNSGSPAGSAASDGNEFDTELFKENVSNILQQKEEEFKKILSEHRNGSDADYGELLQNAFSKHSGEEMQSIEKMNYQDMKVISKTVREINKSLSAYATDSAALSATQEVLGARLGQAEAKAAMVVKYGGINAPLKEKLSEAVERNIDRTIDTVIKSRQEYKGIGELSPIDFSETKKLASSFGKAVNSTSAGFRNEFMGALADVKDRFVNNSTDYVNIVGYINNERDSINSAMSKASKDIRTKAVSGAEEKILSDWNEFVDQLDISNKQDYYVPGAGRNIINIAL